MQGGGFSPVTGLQGLHEDVAASRAADELAQEFGSAMHLRPSFHTIVYFGAYARLPRAPIAYAEGLDVNGGTSGLPITCLISRNVFRTSAATRDETLAHEVFHCIQMQILGSMDRFSPVEKREPWLTEGGATWAACRVSPGIVGEAWVRRYLETPESGLFARSYSAVGFFSEVDRAAGIDPFETMAAALRAGSSAAAFHRLLAGHEEDLFDSWAASYAQDAARGSAWDAGGPCYKPTTPHPQPLTINPAAPQTVHVGSLATTLRELMLGSGSYILQIHALIGRARISARGIDDVIKPDGPDGLYVVGGGGGCPQMTSTAGAKPLIPDGKPVLLALAGEFGGGEVTVSALGCSVSFSGSGASSYDFQGAPVTNTESDCGGTSTLAISDRANPLSWSDSWTGQAALGGHASASMLSALEVPSTTLSYDYSHCSPSDPNSSNPCSDGALTCEGNLGNCTANVAQGQAATLEYRSENGHLVGIVNIGLAAPGGASCPTAADSFNNDVAAPLLVTFDLVPAKQQRTTTLTYAAKAATSCSAFGAAEPANPQTCTVTPSLTATVSFTGPFTVTGPAAGDQPKSPLAVAAG